jgi:hypothetical protein
VAIGAIIVLALLSAGTFVAARDRRLRVLASCGLVVAASLATLRHDGPIAAIITGLAGLAVVAAIWWRVRSIDDSVGPNAAIRLLLAAFAVTVALVLAAQVPLGVAPATDLNVVWYAGIIAAAIVIGIDGGEPGVTAGLGLAIALTSHATALVAVAQDGVVVTLLAIGPVAVTVAGRGWTRTASAE